MPAEKRSAYGVPLAIATLLVLDALVAWAVGIHGNFPLGDDWAYAWPVRSLCEHGEIDLLPWTGASSAVQIWYGAALCRIFGFSFEVLRASTLFLGATADVGIFVLARFLGVSTALSLFAALTFALSPLRVNLGFTFMTDVPFTALAVWSVCAFVRAMQRRSLRFLLVGALLAGAASLVRQNGLFVAVAAGLTLLVRPWDDDDTPRVRLQHACVAVAPSVLALGAYLGWLYWIEGLPEAVLRKAGEAARVDVLTLGNLVFRALEYLGFLLLPLALACRREVSRTAPTAVKTATLLLGAGAIFLFLRESALMPYLSPVIHDFGLGAVTLRDTLFLGLERPGALGSLLQAPLTVVVSISAGFILTSWLVALRHSTSTETLFLAVLLACLIGGSLLHTRYYYDRYILPMQPASIILTAVAIQRTRDVVRIGPGAILALFVIAAYSLAGTHDYLAWNRARFGLLEQLTAAGIEPERIDGGVEFNGWRLAKISGRSPSDDEARVGHAASEKSWWWVVDDEYIVSMRPLPGYELYASRPYDTWLVPGRASVVVLHRSDSAPGTMETLE